MDQQTHPKPRLENRDRPHTQPHDRRESTLSLLRAKNYVNTIAEADLSRAQSDPAAFREILALHLAIFAGNEIVDTVARLEERLALKP